MARNYTVTATIKATACAVKYYNSDQDELAVKTINLKKFDNSWDDEKKIKVLRQSENMTVKLISTEEVSALYGMDDKTWMEISKPINEDERRGLITRTSNTFKPCYYIFDSNNPQEGQKKSNKVFTPVDFKKWSKDKKESYIRDRLDKGVFLLYIVDDEGETISELRGVEIDKFVEKAVLLNDDRNTPAESTEELTEEVTEG